MALLVAMALAGRDLGPRPVPCRPTDDAGGMRVPVPDCGRRVDGTMVTGSGSRVAARLTAPVAESQRCNVTLWFDAEGVPFDAMTWPSEHCGEEVHERVRQAARTLRITHRGEPVQTTVFVQVDPGEGPLPAPAPPHRLIGLPSERIAPVEMWVPPDQEGPRSCAVEVTVMGDGEVIVGEVRDDCPPAFRAAAQEAAAAEGWTPHTTPPEAHWVLVLTGPPGAPECAVP